MIDYVKRIGQELNLGNYAMAERLAWWMRYDLWNNPTDEQWAAVKAQEDLIKAAKGSV